MKLYTRTGDDGSTGLGSGSRMSKDCQRVEAIGTVDELNCAVGLCRCNCDDPAVAALLEQSQRRLFEIGCELANVGGSGSQGQSLRTGPHHIQNVEHEIDALDKTLTPLRHFILPGGGELAARLHMARAICRRAERVCIALRREEDIDPNVVMYLNRLGDLLFVAARAANRQEGVVDIQWQGTDG